jgi:hypothetical protein
MMRSKRDVDRHVEQLEAERNLQAFAIAEMYHNVGEYEMARKYLGEYISGLEEYSSRALKLHGQVLEALQQRDKAVKSHQDQGDEELVLRICELLSGSDLDKRRIR